MLKMKHDELKRKNALDDLPKCKRITHEKVDLDGVSVIAEDGQTHGAVLEERGEEPESAAERFARLESRAKLEVWLRTEAGKTKE